MKNSIKGLFSLSVIVLLLFASCAKEENILPLQDTTASNSTTLNTQALDTELETRSTLVNSGCVQDGVNGGYFSFTHSGTFTTAKNYTITNTYSSCCSYFNHINIRVLHKAPGALAWTLFDSYNRGGIYGNADINFTIATGIQVKYTMLIVNDTPPPGYSPCTKPPKYCVNLLRH